MVKKSIFTALVIAIITSINIAYAAGIEIGEIIATESDPNETMTAEITDIQVEQANKVVPFPTIPPDVGGLKAEVGDVDVSFGATEMQSFSLMAASEEEPAENLVTVTFELRNTASRAGEFKIYAGIYGETAQLYSVAQTSEKLEATEKKKIILQAKVPNNGKDSYGKIFVWDEMYPISKAAEFIVRNTNPDNYPNVTINRDIVLTKDLYYNDVQMTSGIVDLNGHKLYINGKLTQSGGTMFLDNGELVVNGDYIVSNNGILNMTNERDKVFVGGNFTMQSKQSHSAYLQNGALEIKGDFKQISAGDNNFDASKNHKVVFSGSEEQNISFGSQRSGFAIVEFKNENIKINSNMRSWKMTTDVTLQGDVINKELNVDLNGHKLHIKGSYVQSGGTMKIGGGTLEIDGDYRIEEKGTNAYGDATYSYSYGILNMTNENDKVLVKGDFAMYSKTIHSAYLQNGVLEIKGNFKQSYVGGYNSNDAGNFDASKNHKVIFSGSEEQNISFASTASGFAVVEFKNENIKINSDMRSWKMTTDLTLQGDVINKELNVDLNGHKLHIKGSYVQSGGTMKIGGGTLEIDGDYRIEEKGTNAYGDATYSYSYGILNMTNENDKVLVKGDFAMYSKTIHSAYLQNGVLEIKGDFKQSYVGGYNSRDDRNFDASKNHKVIFSGSEEQNISFASTSSGFAVVEFKNENIKINSNMRSWKMTTDLTLQGDVINKALNVDLNGHKLHIKGSYIQSGGTMKIGGGTLEIDGDYRIATKETDTYGDATYSSNYGILNMTNENDKVLVKGDFEMQSENSHSAYLQNGALEIMGDFIQIGDRYQGSINFDASKNHKVILSGGKQQNISFESGASHFNILILTKPYETGYTFNRTPCWNEIYLADAVSINYGGRSGAYAPTGNYSQEFTDMTFLSAAGDTAITRTYNSQDKESSVFNQGWTLGISAMLTDEGDGYKKIKLPDGSTCTFLEESGTYKAQDSRSTLTKAEDGGYILKSKAQAEYRFSALGKIVSMSDRYGNTTRFDTDSSGNITVMTEPSGKRLLFSYSGGKLASIRDERAGTAVTYEYTGGNLSKVTSQSGVCTYYEYDNSGRLSKILDHDRNIVNEIAYDSDNRVSSLTDEYGNKFTYSYDMAQGKTIITDLLGRQKVQWYDSTFNVTKNQDAEGGITATEYNMTNGINKYNEQRVVTDRNGRNTYYERDDRGNVIKQTNPDGSFKLYTYDEFNNIVKERDENGNYTYYIYDEGGVNLLKQVKPIDGVSEYSEDANAENFAVTSYEYYKDEYPIKGLIKSKTEPEGLVTEFTYYNDGMLKTSVVTDSKDNTCAVHEYHYNSRGLPDYEIAPSGAKTTYEYDNAGNIKKLTVGNASSVIEYDRAGRKIKEVSPKEYEQSKESAKGQTYSYYPSGKIKSKTDSLGNTTLYSYDIYGNTVCVTNPNGSQYKYEYDGIGRKTKEYFKDKADFVLTNEYSYSVDSGKNSTTTETVWLDGENSITTVNTLDYRENLLNQLRADGTSISKSYDAKGNIKAETDAKGNTKEYFYNALGKVVSEKIPFDGNYQYKRYTYDSAGNKLSEEITNNAPGQAEKYSLTRYTYNSRGLLTSAAGYDGGVIKSAAQYVYDKSGNKVRVYTGLSALLTVDGIDNVTDNGDSDYSVRKYEYDFWGNVTKATDALGNFETYSYDGNGNRISYTDRNGNTVSYTYDVMNNMTGKSVQGSSYQYKYDCMGNKTAVSGDFNAKYTYDGKGNLLSEETDKYTKSYSYDLQGNTMAFKLNYDGAEKINTSYSYDSMARLSGVWADGSEIASYTYDNNGNRTSVVYDNGITTSYGFNKANLITSVKDNHNEFTYDYYMNGQQKSKTENGEVEGYVYDGLGRLVQAGAVTYAYDDYNNRIGEHSYDKNGRIIGYSYDKNGNLLSDGVHNYTYDKWNRLIFADGENYAYDDMSGRVKAGEKLIVSNTSAAAYITDGASEQIYQNGASPVYSIINGEKNYFCYNGHGDVAGLCDVSGNLTKSYSYDVFGSEKNIDVSDENPLRYAGRFYDVSSGNYYMNSRYYDSDTGRFLSQDSFYGYDEDILSLNQYTYCYNDPIQYVDLSGNSVVSTAQSILNDSITKAGKDTVKEMFRDSYSSAIGVGSDSQKDYFGTFIEKSQKNILKGTGKKLAGKLGISTEYSVLEPVIESGIKNITDEFNSSQKENRSFNMGNVVGNTASGVVLSYIKSAPGVGQVYDMCLDLKNGDVFKNLHVKTFTKAVDVVAKSMNYEPIDWNAGKNVMQLNTNQFKSDYSTAQNKGMSSNTSYWYAMFKGYSRKVDRANTWARKNGYIR